MLKEQDELIELIRDWIIHPEDKLGALLSTEDVFDLVEQMIEEHHENPLRSRLSKYIPRIGKVFLSLQLSTSLHEYNKKVHLLKRRFVPPTFKEIRHIFNLATIHAIAPKLKLVTLDADDTIYEDGGIITEGSEMADIIVQLLKRGIVVSLVTAAGYPGQVEKYEERLRGILDSFYTLDPEIHGKFLVMGGECNYLHKTRVDKDTGKVFLELVDTEKWKDGRGVRWTNEAVNDMLDIAQRTLLETVTTLELPAKVVRKERACGIINTGKKRFSYEVLEEIALHVQDALSSCKVPHCAFNGGNDVWVDVGNKALGITALQKYVPHLLNANSKENDKITTQVVLPENCLHVGDRFTRTGNDSRAREVSVPAWVSNPEETINIMKKLLRDLDSIGKKG